MTLQIVASLIDDASQSYEAKLASSITIVSTFIVQASFMIVTYEHQNMFVIQATGFEPLTLRSTAECSTNDATAAGLVN